MLKGDHVDLASRSALRTPIASVTMTGYSEVLSVARRTGDLER